MMEKDLDSYLADGNFVIQKQDLDDDLDGLAVENSDDSNCGDDGDGDGDGDLDGGGGLGAPLREQDRFLPIANVAKIMKRAIPDTGKIAKEARECVQECVSEFISFITSEASDRCHMEKRKTINGEDILFAMSTLGFDNYVEPLKLYLHKYREVAKTDRNVVGVTGVVELGGGGSFAGSDTGNYSGETSHNSHSQEHQTVIYTYHQPDNMHINF